MSRPGRIGRKKYESVTVRRCNVDEDVGADVGAAAAGGGDGNNGRGLIRIR